jgi:hypothetical protein
MNKLAEDIIMLPVPFSRVITCLLQLFPLKFYDKNLINYYHEDVYIFVITSTILKLYKYFKFRHDRV